jgi:hypothetical protein
MNNKYLLDLQQEWLESRESISLYQELFSAVKIMAEIQIKHICATKGLNFPLDRICSLAIDVTLEIMERYQSKPKWRVQSNYINVIRLGCIKRMFDNRFREKVKLVHFDEDYNASEYISPDSIVDDSEEIKFINRECKESYRESLQTNSQHFEELLKDAQSIKKFPFFIKRIAKYCSINWLKPNIYDLKLLWEEFHGGV